MAKAPGAIPALDFFHFFVILRERSESEELRSIVSAKISRSAFAPTE